MGGVTVRSRVRRRRKKEAGQRSGVRHMPREAEAKPATRPSADGFAEFVKAIQEISMILF